MGKHVAVPKHLKEPVSLWRRRTPGATDVRVPPVVYALGTGVFAVGMSEFMIAGLLPEIAADVNVSVAAAGFLVSAFAVGMFVGAPVMTALTLRLSPRLVLTGALPSWPPATCSARARRRTRCSSSPA